MGDPNTDRPKTYRSMKTQELMFTERSGLGIAAKIEMDHGRMRPDHYDELYAKFLLAAGFKCGDTSAKFVYMHTLHPDQTDREIWWVDHLCPDGVRITLMVMPGVSADILKDVKTRLRKSRDVVSFKTLRVDKLIQFNLQIP